MEKSVDKKIRAIEYIPKSKINTDNKKYNKTLRGLIF